MIENRLDYMWAQNQPVQSTPYVGEVVVGAGLHAAIYCAVRAATGKSLPLVLEARERVGGAFAISRTPSFYLNSRNRPGPLSIPGEGYALNMLPGAVLQPSDLNGDEYQTNQALAWVIRITLAMYADVVPNAKVMGYERKNSAYVVALEDGRQINTSRIIFATGLGEPKTAAGFKHERILTFDDFMRRMGEPYPLRGMQRVAVLGGGDGGKTVIEGLCGQGPSAMTSSSLDYLEKIDWYGAPWASCIDCTNSARVRYKRLSSLLPDSDRPRRQFRVSPRTSSSAISAGYDSVLVGQQIYDYLIDATGYQTKESRGQVVVVNEVRAGRQYEDNVFMIGPSAQLEVTESEQAVLRQIDENKTSIFRYANRTATLAASLN